MTGGTTERTAMPLAEYFRRERATDEKHEYRDGRMCGVPYDGPEHSLIGANVTGELSRRLAGSGLRAYDTGLPLRIGRAYGYADGSVFAGRPEADEADPFGETYVNPRLVVEVLGPSTEAYDRTEKFATGIGRSPRSRST